MFCFALFWKLLSLSNRQRCKATQAGGFAQSILLIALSLSPSAASQGITLDLGSASFPLRHSAKLDLGTYFSQWNSLHRRWPRLCSLHVCQYHWRFCSCTSYFSLWFNDGRTVTFPSVASAIISNLHFVNVFSQRFNILLKPKGSDHKVFGWRPKLSDKRRGLLLFTSLFTAKIKNINKQKLRML